MWELCKDHFNGYRFDPLQLFWLHVNVHNESQYKQKEFLDVYRDRSALPETTKVVIAGHPHHPQFKCMTMKKIELNAEITFEFCSPESFDRRQAFQTVQGYATGSHFQTTVGLIRSAENPSLCVGRTGGEFTTKKQLVLPVSDSPLKLLRCERTGDDHLVNFEFQLVD